MDHPFADSDFADSDDQYIVWETWSGDGVCVKTSKRHRINLRMRTTLGQYVQTLCGTRIPAEGNGIVHEDAACAHGVCKKCEAADARAWKALEDEEKARRRAEGVYAEFGC